MASPKLAATVSQGFKEYVQLWCEVNGTTEAQLIRTLVSAHIDYILLPEDSPTPAQPNTTHSRKPKLSPEEALAARRERKTKREQELQRARLEIEQKYQGRYPWQQEAS